MCSTWCALPAWGTWSALAMLVAERRCHEHLLTAEDYAKKTHFINEHVTRAGVMNSGCVGMSHLLP